MSPDDPLLAPRPLTGAHAGSSGSLIVRMAAPVPRQHAVRLALAAVGIIAAMLCCAALGPQFHWLRRHMDVASALVQGLVCSGPFLLVAAAALRPRASRLAWGLLASALALLSLASGLILFLCSAEPRGMAQAGMGEALLTLALLLGEYAVAVSAAILGGSFDFLSRRWRSC